MGYGGYGHHRYGRSVSDNVPESNVEAADSQVADVTGEEHRYGGYYGGHRGGYGGHRGGYGGHYGGYGGYGSHRYGRSVTDDVEDKNIVTEVIVVVMAVILDMVDTPAMVMVMVDTVVTTKSINPNLKSIRSTLFFFVGNLMYHALV